MPLSAYARNKVMDDLLSGEVFISAHVSDPGLGGANEIANTTATAYARQSVTNGFALAVDGGKVSIVEVQFDEMPESTVTHLGVWSAKTGGDFIWGAELLKRRELGDGDTLKFKRGGIALGLS